MSANNQFYQLSGQVQHYQWGGYNFIPNILGFDNSAGKPCAEYWLGAHVNAPSTLTGAEPGKLNDYIAQHHEVLGEKIYNAFKELPYLLKILDVKDMLSIQVHPTKQAAMADFAKENAAGIPLNAPNRNYKDNNHKPEIMTALSEFWLLHGFKTPELMRQTLSEVKELNFLLPYFENDDYKRLYAFVMELPQADVNTYLQPLLSRILPLYKANQLQKNNPDFWAARAAITFNQGDQADRGIFSIYLLNIMHVQPGEAVFQDAGILHAYLEGQNIELMANSDNVLRGGLTPKHIDVPELMRHVKFVPVTPAIIQPDTTSTQEKVYHSPAPDFELSVIPLPGGASISPAIYTTDIFLVMQGNIEVAGSDKKLALKKGDAFVAFNNAAPVINCINDAVIYRASVPNAV